MGFVHLYGHSTYSLLEAIGSVSTMLTQAKKLNMKHLGIVDYNGMYGAVNFFKKSKDYDINPLIGVELTFFLVENPLKSHKLGHTLAFLARNYEGYQALMKLTSQAYMRDADDPYLLLEDLSLIAEHVYVIIGGTRSWVASQLQQGVSERQIADGLEQIELLVGRDSLLYTVTAQSYDLVSEAQAVNDFVMQYYDERQDKFFASTNFHYPTVDDKYAAEVALAIKDGNKMYEDNRRKIHGDYHLMSESEVSRLLTAGGFAADHVEQLMNNTEKLAETISIKIPLWQSLFPNYEPSEEMKSLYEANKDSLVE